MSTHINEKLFNDWILDNFVWDEKNQVWREEEIVKEEVPNGPETP